MTDASRHHAFRSRKHKDKNNNTNPHIEKAYAYSSQLEAPTFIIIVIALIIRVTIRIIIILHVWTLVYLHPRKSYLCYSHTLGFAQGVFFDISGRSMTGHGFATSHPDDPCNHEFLPNLLTPGTGTPCFLRSSKTMPIKNRCGVHPNVFHLPPPPSSIACSYGSSPSPVPVGGTANEQELTPPLAHHPLGPTSVAPPVIRRKGVGGRSFRGGD